MSIFKIKNQESYARRGTLTLHHGKVETPVFMPVGTYGVVKTQSPEELVDLGSQIILGNTYHLYLRPGLEVLKKFNGLHRFMHWEKPILTDSGGFQVFSLSGLKNITDKGVTFRSPLNGDLIELTPEISAQIQRVIGSDIAMVFDECVALPNTKEVIEKSVIRSAEWAKRFYDAPRLESQKIFAINQGGTDHDLRLLSLEKTMCLPLDGLAIGGLSVGESHHDMIQTLENLAPHLPKNLPHYLMGVGTPLDILEAVRLGIDMFDCVLPTRNARNGGFFTDSGLLNIRNSEHKDSEEPIDSNCLCPCCLHYSRSYLRHLFQIKEILGCRLATAHNLYYYHGLMRQIREALEKGAFKDFYQSKISTLRSAYLKETV